MHRLSKTFAVVLAGGLLAACGSEDSGGSGGGGADPYQVVVVAGLSGALEIPSKAVLASVEVAAKNLNEEHDGILGREVEVVGLDSTGDPTQAVSVLQDHIGKNGKPDLVVPGLSSGESLALTPLLTRQKIMSNSNASSGELDDPAKFPYHFGTVPTAAGQMAALPGTLEEMGVSKMTALLGEDAFGEGVVAALEEALADSDVEVTVERFDPEAVDMSVAYERALSSKPDAVYLDCFGESCGRLFDAREKVGGQDVPTFTGSGVSGTGGGPASFASPTALENVYMHMFQVQKFVAPEERSETFAAFFDPFLEEMGGSVDSSILAPAYAYEGILAVAAAAEEAESVDADKVAAALEDLEAPADYFFGYEESGPGYSADDHFPMPSPELFAYLPPGPAKDGMFEVADS